MKKTILLTLLLGLFAIGIAKPRISNLSYPESVDIFGLYEIAFSLNSYNNPYDPDVIDVYAEFVAPDNSHHRVNGFYFEPYTFSKNQNYEVATAGRDSGWRVRFTPDQTGTWTFVVHAVDRNGSVQMPQTSVTFQCNAIDTEEGFISIANTRYLKRSAIEKRKHTSRPFYPIGPNIAWYGYENSNTQPKGIYDYDRYINTIEGSANYIRIWLTRYQYLSLYGPEYTQKDGKNPKVYFNSTLNQKDAAELDHIVAYAARHGINIMPCIFTFGDFCEKNSSASRWKNNPFNTILGLKSGDLFFSDKESKRIAKNLIRYIVARWGYATNIVCWELWNEVDNIPFENLSKKQFARNITSWHDEMAQYIRSIDPFGHPITTSGTTAKSTDPVFTQIFKSMDIVQIHTYDNIQKAKSKEVRCRHMLEKSELAHSIYPDKLSFIGEFGFGQSSTNPRYKDKDPKGIDTHNCLWSSMFSSSMGPASFWFWDYLDKAGLMRIYEPMLTYSKNLPILSDAYKACSTAELNNKTLTHPNGIQTYYLINLAEDSLFGWCQDTAFTYQALRRLTDKMGKNRHFDNDGVFDPKGYVYTLNTDKRPKPSSKSNTITLPITSQPAGTEYIVRWFDAETGLEIPAEQTTAVVKKRTLGREKHLSFEFPSRVRDLKNKKVNNKLCDAAFIITLKQDNAAPTRVKSNGTLFKPVRKGNK